MSTEQYEGAIFEWHRKILGKMFKQLKNQLINPIKNLLCVRLFECKRIIMGKALLESKDISYNFRI